MSNVIQHVTHHSSFILHSGFCRRTHKWTEAQPHKLNRKKRPDKESDEVATTGSWQIANSKLPLPPFPRCARNKTMKSLYQRTTEDTVERNRRAAAAARERQRRLFSEMLLMMMMVGCYVHRWTAPCQSISAVKDALTIGPKVHSDLQLQIE